MSIFFPAQMHPQFLPAPRSAIYEVLQNFSQDAHVSTHLSFRAAESQSSLPSLILERNRKSRPMTSRLISSLAGTPFHPFIPNEIGSSHSSDDNGVTLIARARNSCTYQSEIRTLRDTTSA